MEMRYVGFCSNRFRPLFVVVVILSLGTPENVLGQSRSSFPVPSVIGLTVSEAENHVYSAGRSFRATSAKAQIVGRRPDVHPAGRIIQQLESPSTPMRPYMNDLGGT